MVIKNKWIVWGLLLLLPIPGYAQLGVLVKDSASVNSTIDTPKVKVTQEDIMEQERWDSLETLVDKTGYDARRFIGQKRYIPENESFIEKNSWSDHLFFALSGGWGWMDQSENKRVLKEGSRAHFYVGKEFTSIHGARLGVGFNSFVEQRSKQNIKNYAFRADYLCNFSSMLWKYNPHRLMDVVGVAGLSYYRTNFGEVGSKAYGMNFGLQFLFKAGSNTAITIEPGLSVNTDGYDLMIGGGRHKMHTTYGVELGLKYTFTDENLSWPCDTLSYLLKNTFVEMSTGASSYPSGALGWGGSLGSAYTLSLGKWLTPGIGFRVSTTLAENLWKEAVTTVPDGKSYIYEEMQGYGGARVEALVNPLGFGSPYDFKRNAFFEVNLAAGGEMGWLMKTDYDVDGKKQFLKCDYLGLTGGIQFLFRPYKDFAFFLEPRISMLKYDIPYANRPELSKEYSDEMYSLNIGFRMSAPAKNSCTKETEDILPQTRFLPYYYAAVGGGLSNLWQNKHYKDASPTCGWSATLSGGYYFLPYLGVRVNASLARTTISEIYNYVTYITSSEGTEMPFRYRGLWNRGLHQFTLSANLEVSLSNLYMGYDANRKFDVSILLGPAYSGIVNSNDRLADVEIRVGHNATIQGNSPSDYAWGLEGGISVSARLNERLRLTLLPRVNAYSRDFIPSSINAGRWMGLVTTNLFVEYQF